MSKPYEAPDHIMYLSNLHHVVYYEDKRPMPGLHAVTS